MSILQFLFCYVKSRFAQVKKLRNSSSLSTVMCKSTGPASVSSRMLKSIARSIAPVWQNFHPITSGCYLQVMETMSAQFLIVLFLFLQSLWQCPACTPDGQAGYSSFGPNNYYLDSLLPKGQISDCCCWRRTIHQPPCYLWRTTGVGISVTYFYNLQKWCCISLPCGRIFMFADDIALYRTIYALADYTVLLDDIIAISQRVDDNFLTLHAEKYCLMFVPHKLTSKLSFSNPPSTVSGYFSSKPGQLGQIPACLRYVLVPSGN